MKGSGRGQLEILPRHLPSGTEEKSKHSKQDDLCPSCNSKPVPSEFSSDAVLLELICPVVLVLSVSYSLGSRKKSCLANLIGGWIWSTVDLHRVESKHEHAGSSRRNYSIPSSCSHVYAMLLFGGRSRVIAPLNFNLGPKCR